VRLTVSAASLQVKHPRATTPGTLLPRPQAHGRRLSRLRAQPSSLDNDGGGQRLRGRRVQLPEEVPAQPHGGRSRPPGTGDPAGRHRRRALPLPGSGIHPRPRGCPLRRRTSGGPPHSFYVAFLAGSTTHPCADGRVARCNGADRRGEPVPDRDGQLPGLCPQVITTRLLRDPRRASSGRSGSSRAFRGANRDET